MRGFAKAQVLGTSGMDPEVRMTNSGKKVANLSIATNNMKANGEEETMWHRVTVFDKLAEVAEKFVKKGTRLYVDGRIIYRKWEKDGVERVSTEIIAYDLQLVSSKQESQGQSSQPANGNVASPSDKFAEDDSDDIPF